MVDSRTAALAWKGLECDVKPIADMKVTEEFELLASRQDLDSVMTTIRGRHPRSLVLLRGQTDLYPSVRSGRSRPGFRTQPAEDQGWVSVVGQLLKAHGGSATDPRTTGAVLQHYGLATHYVDLTSSQRVAAWFACNQYVESTLTHMGSAYRRYKTARYVPLLDGIGFVLVLVFERPEQEKASLHLFDLGGLPGFERPKRQSGWLMYDRRPLLPDPNAYCRYILRLDRSKYKDSSLEQGFLFPGPEQDAGYAGLLGVPYVQIPSACLDDFSSKPPKQTSRRAKGAKPSTKGSRKRASEKMFEEICFATRLVDVPEYVGDGTHELVNHKWADVTIYEPHHMRVWYRWSFDIGTIHPGVSGNINETTKVTVAERALKTIRKLSQSVPSRWLELGTSGNFFTFVAWDHDKVIEHGPPYHGVWLQRQDDLIVEVPMSADDALSVHAGHVYLHWEGKLHRQWVEKSCKCDKPETHDARVVEMMAVPGLIENGDLRMVPHPFGFPRWYVLW
jgi:FRG domain